MVRIGPSGTVGLLAVALVAHLWMFPSLADTSTAGTAPTAAVQAPDHPLVGGCPSGMASCISADTDKVLPLLLVALSTLPCLLVPGRSSVSAPRRWTRRGPPPLLTPVTARVLLLE